MEISRFSLRMKLDDFINDECEKKVLSILEKLQGNASAIISLILWFDDDFKGNLKEAIKSIEGAHHWKTNIVQKSNISPNDFVWWDIRSYNDCDAFKSNWRFRYLYNNESQLLTGVKEFSKAITFFRNKPAKERKIERKQKRNDL